MDYRILYDNDPSDKQLVTDLFAQVCNHVDGNEFRAVSIVSRVLGLMVSQVAQNGSTEDAMTVSTVVLEQLEKVIRLAQKKGI